MRIWVDADACPNVIKDILFRAAERPQVTLTLIAKQRSEHRLRSSSRRSRFRLDSMSPTIESSS
jgi:uncharacterized protein YaiI (UPF0178 family)